MGHHLLKFDDFQVTRELKNLLEEAQSVISATGNNESADLIRDAITLECGFQDTDYISWSNYMSDEIFSELG